MFKLITQVQNRKAGFEISLQDSCLVLGSCFADSLAGRMSDAGFRVCANPFGTLYNPVSVVNSLERLESARPFIPEECVEMGAGAGLFCSFSHHSAFAGKTPEEWLRKANQSLKEASTFWKKCNSVIIILGNAWVWEHDGKVVSNCLKRPSKEFNHRMLELQECCSTLERIKELCADRKLMFCVCPIRQMGDRARANTLSKATLQLAVHSSGAEYFPASEILLDELRDYRYYADDLIHPSSLAMNIIWERFVDAVLPESEKEQLLQNEKSARAALHQDIHQSI